MKKILFLFCFCLLFIEFSEAQIVFQKSFIARTFAQPSPAVLQTNDGGYILMGQTPDSNGNNLYLIKTDAYGDTLWAKVYGSSYLEYGRSILQTSDSGFIICGHTEVNFNTDYVLLLKVDVNGNLQWWKNYGGGQLEDVASSVVQTNDGGYLVCGYTTNYGAGYRDIYLIRTDASGNNLWTETFGRIHEDNGSFIAKTSDGGYIITGDTYDTTGGNVYVIKIDSAGTYVWSKTYGGGGLWSRGSCVQQTTDGGFIVAGDYNSINNNYTDMYLIKLNSIGDTLWTRTYGGTDEDIARFVQQTNDGGYILTGTTWSFGYNSACLIKTNANGDTLWTRLYGTTTSSSAFSVQQTSDDGYIIGGSISPTGIYMIKTDSLGNSNCYERNPAIDVASPVTFITNPSTIASFQTIQDTLIQLAQNNTVSTIFDCAALGEPEITKNDLFSISPNPFTSEISITLQKQNIKQATISIKNILGQTVFSKQLQTLNLKLQTTLDLSFLEKGIYLVEVVADGSPDSYREVRKIVKE
jgi:hypothetical protein